MNPTELSIAFEAISVEMSNPFAKLGEYSQSKFKQFTKTVMDFTARTLAAIDIKHPNGLYIAAPLVESAVNNNRVIYTDLQPVRVYTPDFLKSKTTMLEYSLALRNDMLLCGIFLKGAPEELGSVIDGYYGNPKRLQDPILINIPQPDGTSLSELEKGIVKNREVNSKIITSTGTSSIRPFAAAYARLGDYKHTNILAKEINDFYKEYIDQIHDFSKRVNEANKKVERLLNKVQTDPNFAMSGSVGEYLSKQIYRLAAIVEYFGATLYNAQVYLKAVSDTNVALTNVVK
jgi:hypothetical protein